MSGRHTPGPWVAGRPDMATIVDGHDAKWVYAEDGRFPDRDTYVAVASGMDIEDWREVVANARLIAAAPDYDEASRFADDVLAQLEGFATLGPNIRGRIAEARSKIAAAIAKAEGGDS